MSDDGDNTGCIGNLIMLALVVAIVYIVAKQFNSDYWHIRDLQQRVATLEQQCK